MSEEREMTEVQKLAKVKVLKDMCKEYELLAKYNGGVDYDRWKALEMLIKALSQEQEPKWIPVSERLPEDSELVLFSTNTDRVFEGRYFADNTDRQWYAFRDECFAWNNVVTAWMPLPTPYEPQESEEV